MNGNGIEHDAGRKALDRKGLILSDANKPENDTA